MSLFSSTVYGLDGISLALRPDEGVVRAVVEPQLLIHLLAHLRYFVDSALVIQVPIVDGNHSSVFAFKSSGLSLFYSSNQEAAERDVVYAAQQAAATHKAVIHFGEFDVASLSADAPAASAPVAYTPVEYFGSSHATTVIVALANTTSFEKGLPQGYGLVKLNQYRPLAADVLQRIPETATTVVTLDQGYSKPGKYNYLFLDILALFAESERVTPRIVGGLLGLVSYGAQVLSDIAAYVKNTKATTPLVIGTIPAAATVPDHFVPQHESSYTTLLGEIFGDRLAIVNKPDALKTTSPEYALGDVLARAQQKKQLQKVARETIASVSAAPELVAALQAWLASPADEAAAAAAQAAAAGAPAFAGLTDAFAPTSNWIVGSEAWSHDLGASGLHHALSTGANVNLLLIDHTPYALPADAPPPARKDAGLYAMNYGGAYVASVAVYSDFSHTLRALQEADRFAGPSVVVAYLPGGHDDATTALDLLKATKRAVEIGTWPLYRWNPALADADVFQLDSEKIKADLATFLDRQNHLTQLSRKLEFTPALEGGLNQRRLAAQRAKARAAFNALANALEGPPLLVLFASDGGVAEKLARKLADRARARSVAARVLAADDVPVEDLALETNVVFVTSTAGQGEFPQNGRDLWRALQQKPDLATISAGVFGLGDSHYWPDRTYYNKPAKDLHAALAAAGATQLLPLGLGDDQDPDGPQTGYKAWEPLLWKALGVDGVETDETEPEPITNEHIKIASNYLRGTIKEGLNDTSTGALSEADGQLTKFHGIYQQDDRDIREERKAEGLEPAYSFMVRMRLPAGVCAPHQWLIVDEISDTRGNGTFKLTTRQTFQFHGIIKQKLKPAIQDINRCLLDTLAACGDVNRTVMCSCNPSMGPLHETVFRFAQTLSDELKPQTTAYAEIWLDKYQVAGEAVRDVEPLYGKYYLPRKFKIAIAVPPTNDVDVFCHDLGFIAIVGPDGALEGFNVTIGGGMGVTHSMKTTYPRLADVVGFIRAGDALEVAKAVMTTQRDNGNRANRKNARLKYTVDRMGVENFKAEVERRSGVTFAPARAFEFTKNVDEFGWQTGHDGRRHFTCFVENGRVQDEPGRLYKTGLREIAKVHQGTFILTANQHLIIADIPPAEEPTIRALLAKYNLDQLDYSALRLSSAACVAFPTCGLAMAESERYLPVLITKVEEILEEAGLRNDSITMRMTGCPNGCARPWAAEVAFVGKAPGSYLLLLGGGYYGQRLNKIYRDGVNEQEILAILRPLFKSYALERLDGEHFGDFVIRKGIISPTVSGKTFYDGMCPDN